MADGALTIGARRRVGLHPAWLLSALLLPAILLLLRQAGLLVPPNRWGELLAPGSADPFLLIVRDSLLPRAAVCVLGGGALSLAGTLFQGVLRNPLAEPTTLGVSAGASLSLAAGTILLPTAMQLPAAPLALLGATVAMATVLGMSWPRRLAPTTLILCGLIVSLYCGAIGATLTLFNHDALQSLFMWNAGSLDQNNWAAPRALSVLFVPGAILAALLVRPLSVMVLSDAGASGLGVNLLFVRLATLVLAVILSAGVVAYAGVIGFLGMLAPLLARLSGARDLPARLLWSPLIGAALLLFTDELVQLVPVGRSGLPTGVVMSIVGAPFLFWLLPRLPPAREPDFATEPPVRRSARSWFWFAGGALLLFAAVLVGISFGRGAAGWHWSVGAALDPLLPLRAPRVLAALVAGAMLALAGVILQRVTGNDMASPELLGVSSGASLGLIALIFLYPPGGEAASMAASAAGALVTLAVLLLFGRRHRFAPDRMLLLGASLGAVFGASVTVLLATGDPRIADLLPRLAGSTYRVGDAQADGALAVGAVLLLGCAALRRWLDILPLGDAVAREVGVPPEAGRLLPLLLAALLTGTSTLLVGPLSFVGLMAPHLARLLGFGRAGEQMLAASLIGALLMVVADWIGRFALFPFQVPVGLVSTMVGGLYFGWLMLRRS